MKYLTNVLVVLLLFTYTDWVDFIINHEGYGNGIVYEDVLGHKTVGHGHLVKPEETFTFLSKIDARLLLEKDFNISIKLVQNMYPEMEEHKVLALAHFVYAKGIGSYTRSKLKKKIDSNAPKKQVFKEWVEWAIVKGKINSNSLFNRVHEYNTFYGIETSE